MESKKYREQLSNAYTYCIRNAAANEIKIESEKLCLKTTITSGYLPPILRPWTAALENDNYPYPPG
jgi:hypothetical protein